MGEFSRDLPKRGYTRSGGSYYGNDREEWNGEQTYQEAKENIWRGDTDALETSNDLLSRLEGDGIELSIPYWDNDRTGFIPCVPSFLAGSPDSMRRLQEMPSESAPIKIFSDVCLSGGFSADRLAKRGAAILALARKLQAIRPVELYLFASMYGNKSDKYGACAIPVIKIDTNPLDLTTVSYAMANPGFLRQVCFGWGYQHGFDGSWAWNSNPERNRDKFRKYFELSETDLLIDGAYLSDQLMREPLEWVNDQVRRYASVVEESRD